MIAAIWSSVNVFAEGAVAVSVVSAGLVVSVVSVVSAGLVVSVVSHAICF
ncbi:hypothetical protein KBB05_01720 [Patescibacteria group bacterium]|nr:hypothetical protein [Patescibacteria group bacterium]